MKEELIKKYKKEVLHFQGYYKYEFFYSNDVIALSAGGDGNDIYRSDLRDKMTLEKLVEECGTEFMVIRELNK